LYTVVGEQPARILLLFSRSGFEQFFSTDHQSSAAHRPPSAKELEQLVEKYDMELLNRSTIGRRHSNAHLPNKPRRGAD
jgi:hypothetical protein